MCTVFQELAAVFGCVDAPVAKTGWRASHFAAAAGKAKTLAWLAQHGADLSAPTAPNSHGVPHTAFSPAHVAAMHDQLDALKVLGRVVLSSLINALLLLLR
jgi:hypothetical protein